MGAKRKKLSAEADRCWHPYNESVLRLKREKLGRRCDQPVFWRLGCPHKCLAFLSPHAVTKSSKSSSKSSSSSLRCRYCQPRLTDCRPISQWARAVRRQLMRLGLPFVAEACVVRHWPAAVDFWLYQHGLLIQVDGEQHGHKHMHSTSPEQQRLKDAEFDALVWRQGMRLVRIAWQDVWHAGALLTRALSLLEKHPGSRFILYSPACRQPHLIDCCPGTSSHSPPDTAMRPAVAAVHASPRSAFACVAG